VFIECKKAEVAFKCDVVKPLSFKRSDGVWRGRLGGLELLLE